jgi:hypothetical protein
MATTTTATLRALPVDELRAQAGEVRFGRFVLMVITAFFFGIGWCAGASWKAAVFCALAVRYGYRTGAGVPVAPVPAPQPGRA